MYSVVSLLNGPGELFLEAELVFVTMFPRHVDRCCDNEGPMKDVNVLRVMEMMTDGGRAVRFSDGGTSWGWTRT